MLLEVLVAQAMTPEAAWCLVDLLGSCQSLPQGESAIFND
jgi:hypothetical protein